MSKGKKSLKSRLVVWALLATFAIGTGVGFVRNATADTYNFHFTKPKKKTKKSVTVSPQGYEDPAEEQPAPAQTVEEDNDEETEAPVEKKPKAKKDSEERAIIIHNHNYIGGAPAKGGAAPIQEPVSVAPVTPVTPIASNTALVPRPQANDSRWRFGLAGSYWPKKTIKNRDWTNFSTTEGDYKAYGAAISMGWVPSNLFTLNAYVGGSHAKVKEQTMYMVGIDGEFYPFANPSSTELSGLELGVLLGGTTHFATDGNLLAAHVGGRINLNLNNKMGLTTVGRISEDYIMFEAGIITRF